MADVLADLSAALTGVVERSGPWVVRIDGRRRGPTSGSVWSADGVIVAAHHSVERDEDVVVGLPDGNAATAQVVGRDPTTDLVVLRVDRTGLSPVVWREEAPAVGQLVVALTRPGRTARAQLGMVHAVGESWRTPSGGRIDQYIESDTVVSPAFSGGVLVDAFGRAVGLNNAGLLRGASVAVPPATLRRVVDTVLRHGRVRRGFLGVAAVPVRLPGEGAAGATAGLLVSAVESDTPAARAGVLIGDVLLAIEGQPLASPSDLLPYLEEEKIGRAVSLRVLRAGDVRDLQVTPGTREGAAS
jgi:S1-C subfamily serine protease